MAPPPTPAVPRADQPLDALTALIYSPKAPLATIPPSDHSAVWCCVPASFDVNAPTLLIFFHGHNYFVTAIQSGGKVVARASDWLSGTRLTAAITKGTAQGPAGPYYKFNALPAGPPSPLVLMPEDSSEDPAFSPPRKEFWAREANVGTLASASTLGDMVDDCLDRLTKLSPTGGAVASPGVGSYLKKALVTTDLKRLFLTGHSGGGVPLFTACSNMGMALNQATSLWAFDATYGHPAASVRLFCENWETIGRLGMGADDSRVVIIYNPMSGTQPGANEVRDDLRSGGPGAAGTKFSVRELSHQGPRDLPAIESALKSSPIVFINTNVAHDLIPQFFTPILLRNA